METTTLNTIPTNQCPCQAAVIIVAIVVGVFVVVVVVVVIVVIINHNTNNRPDKDAVDRNHTCTVIDGSCG